MPKSNFRNVLSLLLALILLGISTNSLCFAGKGGCLKRSFSDTEILKVENILNYRKGRKIIFYDVGLRQAFVEVYNVMISTRDSSEFKFEKTVSSDFYAKDLFDIWHFVDSNVEYSPEEKERLLDLLLKIAVENGFCR